MTRNTRINSRIRVLRSFFVCFVIGRFSVKMPLVSAHEDAGLLLKGRRFIGASSFTVGIRLKT